MAEPRRRPAFRSRDLLLALRRHPTSAICARPACGWPVHPAAGPMHPGCELEEASRG